MSNRAPPQHGRPPRYATGPLALLEGRRLEFDDFEMHRFSLLWWGFTLVVQILSLRRAPSTHWAIAAIGLWICGAFINVALLRISARRGGDQLEVVRGMTNALLCFGGIVLTGGMASPLWMASFPVVFNPNIVSMVSTMSVTAVTIACQWAAWLLASPAAIDWNEGAGRSALLLAATLFFRMMFDVQTEHRRRATEAARAAERDRASKHEAEARFRLAEQSATHSKMASLGLLAASVAHEINNPINTIINSAQIILDGDVRGASDQERFHRLIISEGERVARVIGNLLQFARGGGEEYGPTPLRRVIDKTLMLLQHQLDKDGVRVEIDLPLDLPPVRARLEELQQVFLNLLTNARYAVLERRRVTPELRPTIQISARANAGPDGPRVLCQVRDNGVGIAAAYLEKIFDPFFTTKPKDEGTGLGLSVSSRIMREHRGRIEVASTVGQETVFTLSLPAVPGAALENSTGVGWSTLAS